MGMVSLTCPNCGATMQIDESREFCFCQYCGTKIMHERIIVEHKGEVSVEGVATYDDLFILGNDYFENSDYERAEVIFLKCLELNPTEFDIHYRLLFCNYRINSLNFEDILFAIEPRMYFENYLEVCKNNLKALENSNEFKSCLKYANEQKRNELLEAVKEEREKFTLTDEKEKEYKQKSPGCLVVFLVFFIPMVIAGFFAYSVTDGDIDLAFIWAIVASIPSFLVLTCVIFPKQKKIRKELEEKYSKKTRK